MTDNRIKIYDPGGAFIGSAVDVDNAQRLQELWIEFNQPERAGRVQWKAHILADSTVESWSAVQQMVAEKREGEGISL